MPKQRHLRKRETTRRALAALRLAQVIRIKPGDVLLIAVDEHASVDQLKGLREGLRSVLPSTIKGVICSGKATATVIHEEA